jgi:chromatin remodeling complex protein RSC6
MSDEIEDNESLRARSEQAIGELAQALLDSQVLENAVAAAFGAREKAAEAQHAAMAALNLPSAGDVERLERRLRSLSQRLDEIEDLVDGMSRDLNTLRRQANSRQADSPAGPEANSSSNAKSAKSPKGSKVGEPKAAK